MVIVGHGDDIPVCPLADKVCVQTNKHPYLRFSFPAYRFFNRSIHLLKKHHHGIQIIIGIRKTETDTED